MVASCQERTRMGASCQERTRMGASYQERTRMGASCQERTRMGASCQEPVRTIRTSRRPPGSWHPNNLLMHLVFYISLLEPYRSCPRFQPLAVKELEEGS